jgi:hypothetical protein
MLQPDTVSAGLNVCAAQVFSKIYFLETEKKSVDHESQLWSAEFSR